MIVMPSNGNGWFWHSLARETGNLGHLFSPGGQVGPWPWFPYALDNGAYSCWNKADNTFDEEKWGNKLTEWVELLHWASRCEQKPMWGIVPDVVGNRSKTLEQWSVYAHVLQAYNIPLAIAVQDGMVPEDVKQLHPCPVIVCIGGSDDFKWGTLESWTSNFDRVHVLRCNSPTKLHMLEELGVESCDGTGWCRGDRKQTAGLEAWARKRLTPYTCDLHPFVCRGKLKKSKKND